MKSCPSSGELDRIMELNPLLSLYRSSGAYN